MLPTGKFADDLLFMTVRLVSLNNVATGFIFKTPKGNKVVVSNKHFVMDKSLPAPEKPIVQKVEMTFHLDDDTNTNFSDNVSWYIHPTEDLAFFQLSEIEKYINEQVSPKKVVYKEISSGMIPSEEDLKNLTALEEIVMVGYPDGRFDAKNNLPLLRYGRTASHPNVDFNDTKRGLIDVFCVPGSSGSPVFLYNELHASIKDYVAKLGPRNVFLGIEVSMPVTWKDVRQKVKDPVLGKYLIDGTNQLITISTDYVYQDDIGMGFYIKASELAGFYPQFDSIGI